MEIINSGNPIVDKVAQMHFRGNVIPKVWFNIIKYENGKPNLVAIILLSEIVYWYRPVEIRDEEGCFVYHKRKFADEEFLQKSYKQISQELGVTLCQAKNAVIFLEKETQVIKRHFRTVKAGKGVVLPNVMFIELFPDKLKEITFHYTVDAAKEGYPNLEMQIPPFENADTPISKYGYPHLEIQTNTKITTKNTDIDSYPINPDYEIVRTTFMEQIDYDAIVRDRPDDKAMLDGIVDLAVDVLTSTKDSIRVVKEDKPRAVVQSRIWRLNMFMVEYVIDHMNKETNKINDPKQYLLASLYNAPSYESLYWKNRVNNDMYGGGITWQQ